MNKAFEQDILELLWLQQGAVSVWPLLFKQNIWVSYTKGLTAAVIYLIRRPWW